MPGIGLIDVPAEIGVAEGWRALTMYPTPQLLPEPHDAPQKARDLPSQIEQFDHGSAAALWAERSRNPPMPRHEQSAARECRQAMLQGPAHGLSADIDVAVARNVTQLELTPMPMTGRGQPGIDTVVLCLAWC